MLHLILVHYHDISCGSACINTRHDQPRLVLALLRLRAHLRILVVTCDQMRALARWTVSIGHRVTLPAIILVTDYVVSLNVVRARAAATAVTPVYTHLVFDYR